MRLHQNAGLVHLVFLQLQNLAQRIHLPAHVLHHLVHGIHFDFALLDSAPARSGSPCARRPSSAAACPVAPVVALAARLPNNCCRFSRVFGSVSVSSFCRISGTGIRIALHLAESSQQADGLNHLGLLQRELLHLPRLARFAVPAALPGLCPGNPVAGTSWNASEGNSRAAALAPAACVGAFRRCNQLQQFLRIVQPLLEFRAQGLRRDLRCHADVASQRVGRHKFHFIDLDRAALAFVVERFFDLLGYILGFGPSDRKGAHQPGEVFDRYLFGEVQAGQSRPCSRVAQNCVPSVRLPAELHPAAACCRKPRAGNRPPQPWAVLAAIRSRRSRTALRCACDRGRTCART